MLYQSMINYLAKISHTNIDLIENGLGSFFVLISYLSLGKILSHLARKNLPDEYKDEVVSEIIPSVMKFIAFGFLAKIWLTGEASLASTFKISKELMSQIVESIYVLLFYLGANFAAEVFGRIKFSEAEARQYTLRRSSNIILSMISLLLMLKIWLSQSANFSTYFGLLSAGLAIALQDVIAGLAGWLYIMTVKPLKVGDRIQIGDKTGDIIDIKLFQFCVLETGHWVGAEQATGRIIYFPNSFIFKNNIANYDAGFEYIFSEIPVMVTFESDWQKARYILTKILNHAVLREKEQAAKQIRKASRDMRLQFAHLEPRVILSVADSGVTLTLRFLCKVRERRFVESGLWEDILKAFANEDGIDFAYPTTRFYSNQTEGKKLAGGPVERPISEKTATLTHPQ